MVADWLSELCQTFSFETISLMMHASTMKSLLGQTISNAVGNVLSDNYTGLPKGFFRILPEVIRGTPSHH